MTVAREQIGRYRTEEVIGVGSFATVYRASDDWLEDTVALKVLAENHSLNPEVRERFIAEGRSLRRIDSPHVITVHDIGESERQQPFLVLEYAERGTLADRVRTLRAQGWTATRADLLVTARALAAAIEAVHEAQLVHRDLSPGNVLIAAGTHSPGPATGTDPGDPSGGPADTRAQLVRPGERLVVADLGMCKDLARNSGLTVAAGTSGFRPPEQEVGGLVDTRADLWSLSAVLEWLCEGADLPAGLAETLGRSRAERPEDRHPDVAGWLADVEAALRPPAPEATTPPAPEATAPPAPDATTPDATAPPTPLPGAPGTTSPDRLAPEHLPGRAPARGRRLGILLVVSVVALALGVLGGYLLARGSGGPPMQTSLASVAIEGPTELTVGQEATFTAEVTGLDSWVWTLPSGRYVLDAPTISLTPQTTGPSHLVLRGQDSDGREVVVEHALQVGD